MAVYKEGSTHKFFLEETWRKSTTQRWTLGLSSPFPKLPNNPTLLLQTVMHVLIWKSMMVRSQLLAILELHPHLLHLGVPVSTYGEQGLGCSMERNDRLLRKKNAFVRRRCFFALMLIQYLLNGSQTMKIPPHTAIPLRRLFYLIARKKFKMPINFILTQLSACTLHGNWKGRQTAQRKKNLIKTDENFRWPILIWIQK